MKKIKEKLTQASFFNWSLTFSKRVILLVTIVWVLAMIYCAAMITVAIFKIDNFSYLDTYINEICTVFSIVVASGIVKTTIENVFRYNDFCGKSTYPDDIQDDDTDEVTDCDEDDSIG